MAHQTIGDTEKLTRTAEEYLETILNISVEGYDVYAARLVERLAVSAPTVSASLGRLKRDGLITVGKDRRILLTPPGRKAAIAIVRRHRLVERLLTDYLGLDWADCHREACLLEHAISENVEERLFERLDRPKTCPHGNPIPVGMAIDMPPCQELTTVPEGKTVEIVRITEEVSEDYAMMKFLQSHKLTPGKRFVLTAVSREANTVTLRSEANSSSELTIASNVAAALFVRSI
jgi:DtxR family transcriptional regulator, Mn-dependent transcriptional regulator